MEKTRRNFVKSGALLGVGGLAGCMGSSDSSTGNDSDNVIIGSNHPLTGGLSYTGGRMDEAMKLAARIKNDNGGIASLGGANISVISGDNEGSQELGSEVTNNLIDQGASVISGCYSSPVTSAASIAAERAGIPFVVSVSVANSILQERKMDYVYRPSPNADQFAIDHAKLMPEVASSGGIDVQTAALFYIDISFGQSIRDKLITELPKYDIEVVADLPINFGESADTQVTRLRQESPDVVIATTYNAETVELARSMDAQSYSPKIFAGCASAALTDISSIAQMGDTAQGALGTNYAVNQNLDRAVTIQNLFEAEIGSNFDANPAMAFATMQVIIEAIEQAGSTNPSDINDELKDIVVDDHILAAPPITFDDRGENQNALTPLYQVQNERPVLVAPDEYAWTEAKF